MCQNAPLGLGVPLSHPTSIYHQLYYAVPAWLHLRAHVAAGVGPPLAFVPLALQSAALGRGKPMAPRRWHAWEFTLRALSRAGAAEIAAAASVLLRTSCTCFGRFEASGIAFSPGARADTPQLLGFRAAALANALASPPLDDAAGIRAASWGPPRSSRDMLFIIRRGARRGLSNEAEVFHILRSLRRVSRIIFEDLTLAEQMVRISSASALIGVHGQAFAWLPFLPWDSRPIALVEISLASRRGVINTCYERWSTALGVHYWRVAGTPTGGCNGDVGRGDNEAMRAHKILACNVTANTAQLAGVHARRR